MLMPFLTKTGGGGNRRDQDQQQRRLAPTTAAAGRRGWLRGRLVGCRSQAGGQLAGSRCPCWGAPADGGSRRWACAHALAMSGPE
jgi:hypothetical protein